MATLKTKILRDVPAYTEAFVIENLLPNPKRKGCDAWDRYERLEEGMTLADAKKVLGKHFAAEMAWNAARGFFDIVEAE
jgi:hypothetical protein